MSGADTTSQLVAALEAAVAQHAEPTALVSVSIELVKPERTGTIVTSLVRKTRTLVFMAAEMTSNGERLATASSVHKVLS